VAALGEICIETEVRRLLGREPEQWEMEAAEKLCRERGAYPAPPDVTFGTEADAVSPAQKVKAPG
jgi:hypothetical protein